jgi:hypothetical protein
MEAPDSSNVSLIEYVLGAAWAVLVVVGGFLIKLFLGLHRRVSKMENNAALIDHDLKGIRQNQNTLERKTEERHRENQQEQAETREFIGDELRELRRRIDRLLERSGGGIEQR